MSDEIPNLKQLYNYLVIQEHNPDIPMKSREFIKTSTSYLREALIDLENKGFTFDKDGTTTVPRYYIK